MKKILIFGVFLAFLATTSLDAAVRDGTNSSRKKTATTQQRVSTTVKTDNKRATTLVSARTTTSPTRTTIKSTEPRATTRVSSGSTRGTAARSATTKAQVRQTSSVRAATTTNQKNISARAAAEEQANTQTRTGEIYEKCKSAYFQCMDQFCMLKNDEYRRCSCNDRVMDLMDVRDTLSETNTKLTEFNENLDVVGMTRGQATAMHTASDGENALTADTSASKALLQAILNSIRGEDTNVSGKMSDLNSINISFDTANAFGITDSAQVIASYNGKALYNAVYPNCRQAVRGDCNDASLQRAVTAYLMAVEQDCNTVQTAIVAKQKELKAAVREGSAMLDLARIENRKNHNSSDLTTCINEVESAILSEEVCGANYHKCLDNGEFIDVSTGKPIAGVANFYELENLLRFSEGRDASTQNLSKVRSNHSFINNFEQKTKKFAHDALDKCTEVADEAWSKYLDKALLDIYYAQRTKVAEIKQGCLDFISKCYVERDASITAAMAGLIDGTTETSLVPDRISLTRTMCSDYVESCNSMFGQTNIIQEYMNLQESTDTLAACRAVVQQCFDKFGGNNYENFYDPNSGLFIEETEINNSDNMTALDWFALYQYDWQGKLILDSDTHQPLLRSPCAKEVMKIDSCTDQIEKIFGGLDTFSAKQSISPLYGNYSYTHASSATDSDIKRGYGWVESSLLSDSGWDTNASSAAWETLNRHLRSTGIATEVYNQIIDRLIVDCSNAMGRFVEAQFINHKRYGNGTYNICYLTYQSDLTAYSLFSNENICPKNYENQVNLNAWGACQCFESGARRSINGLSTKCETASTNCSSDSACTTITDYEDAGNWSRCSSTDSGGRVCPNCDSSCENISRDTVQDQAN